MIADLWTWRSTGAVESLLLLMVGPALLLPLFARRFPRIDQLLSFMGAASLLALGAYATNERLFALPFKLDLLPLTQLVGKTAQTEARAAELLGATFAMVAAVLGASVWRRSSAGPASSVAPPIVALAALLSSLIASSDRMGWVALVAGSVVVGASLRPHARWSAPAFAILVASLAGTHGALMHGLVMAEPHIDGLPALLLSEWAAIALSLLGMMATAWAVSASHRAAYPVITMVLVLAVLAPEGLQQMRRHPEPLDLPAVPHPPGQASRIFGACVTTLDGLERPHGQRSPAHHIVGCDSDPMRLQVLAARSDTPLTSLAVDGPEVHLLTYLGPLPQQLDGWGVTFWSLPLWRLDKRPKPLYGSLVVDLGPPLRITGIQLQTDSLPHALDRSGRVELLILPGEHTLEELLSFCKDAVTIRPLATRCGLALGDPEIWTARAQTHVRGPE